MAPTACGADLSQGRLCVCPTLACADRAPRFLYQTLVVSFYVQRGLPLVPSSFFFFIHDDPFSFFLHLWLRRSPLINS